MTYELNERGGWIVPAHSIIAVWTIIPAYSDLGNDCTLGYRCTLGNSCTLGDLCRLGDGCTLGNDCTVSGIICVRFVCLSNVDGSGRQIVLVYDGKSVSVLAGCHKGTVKEFCEKAKSENKLRYALVIRAAAEALAEETTK